MMNRMVAFLMCFVLMFSVVSCDDQEKSVGYGSMSVEVSNSDNSKTIQPTDESLVFASYTIKGRYGTNEEWSVNETFSSKTIEIDHLEVGDWEFVVEGLNKDGVILAKSEPHIVVIKTNGLAKETYTLDWVEGFGSLKLSVKVQSSRVSSIECQLYDENNNTVGNLYIIEREDSILQDDGLYLFEKVFDEVPTGFYNAKIVMKDKDGEPIGKILHQSVHIHDGLESSFDFSWKGFSNLMPQVDVPKLCFEDGTSIPCDSKILLSTEEEDTSVFYSFDGKSYSSYTETGIDLSQMQNLSNSIKVWVYAEKANMNKSDVGTYIFNIEHTFPDRANAVYTWNKVEGGYECIATSRCLYHKSIECETKAVVNYQVIMDSSCSKEGVGRYTAVFQKNGYNTVKTKDEAIARRHIYDREVVEDKYLKSAATCLGAAIYYKSCECGLSSSEELFSLGNPLGHDLVHHEAKVVTCTGIGWNEYDTCARCEYMTYEEIPALGHKLEHHETKDPTCTEIGWSAYDTCTRCEYTTYNEIAALGHDLVYRDEKEPTCTEIGWDAYDECSRGDYSTKVEKPALGHNYMKHEAKAATCMEIGWDGYVTCARCDYSTYSEIAALGHNLVHYEAKEPTCTEIGWDAYDECSRGDYTAYKEISILGHVFKRIDDEFHDKVCRRCGFEIEDNHHSFKNYKCKTCSTWGRGPAGGYVFYDCDADNESSVNDGRGDDNLMSSECGWRYLEAAPADLRLVDAKPTVDSTLKGYYGGTYRFIFGYYRESSDGSNLYVSGKTEFDDDCTRKGVGEGKRNTKLIIDAMGNAAYESSSGAVTTAEYAARLCNELIYKNEDGAVFEDWFLPSTNELKLMYTNLYKQGFGLFSSDSIYLSSSEVFNTGVWTLYFDDGFYRVNSRGNSFRVHPIRAF